MWKFKKQQTEANSNNNSPPSEEPVYAGKMLFNLTEMAKYFKRHKIFTLQNGLIDGRIKIVDSEEE